MADYSINAVARKVSYTGSAGVGPYAFSFEILDDDDVAVYFNETLLTKTTDYTVTINLNGTGSVTIVTGTNVPTTPDADDLIVIVGARDIERVTDFVTAGDLRASALNEQLDALTIMVQQVAEEVQRSVKAPVYDPTGISMILPKKADRVNAFIAFDANGDVSAAVPSDDVTTLAEVATDIATLADIEDGTIATDAISDTAAIASNVTTVAGIAANVTTVAGNTSNINAVAADATDIGTVAANIADVSAVAAIDSDVSAVAADATDIGTVATDLAGTDTIGTVAGIAADVSAVAAIDTDVSAVAAIDTDVSTVAADGTDIGTVATNIANVNTVATNIANVNSVAADATDIGTVATDIANVNTTATNIANVNTVAGISANVTTVAGISADVSTVAGDSADIQAVAADATDIGTVSSNIADVNTVAGAISDVSTVATNIADVQSFSNVYRIAATDPATSLDKGDLVFNTTDDNLKYYDGTSWNAITPGLTDIVQDLTPQLGGDLDLNGSDITGTGDINITGSITATSFVGIDTDKIEEGNSSVEVVDTGTGYVAVTVDGSETARFDANGRLGIGTTSPSVPLHIEHGASDVGLYVNGAFNFQAKFESSDGVAGIILEDNASTTDGNRIQVEGDNIFVITGNQSRGRFDSAGNFQFNSGYGSVATAYGCRAWVNFNGTGTVAIREDGNVSSITDNGAGDYTVNFTTAMPDTNYCVVATTSGDAGNFGYLFPAGPASNQFTDSTSSIRVGSAYASDLSSSTTFRDPHQYFVAIFR